MKISVYGWHGSMDELVSQLRKGLNVQSATEMNSGKGGIKIEFEERIITGRPAKIDKEQVILMRENTTLSYREIARHLNCSKASVIKIWKDYQKEQENEQLEKSL